jgi:tRNA1Val (adenine37-N6)-methyltransferase
VTLFAEEELTRDGFLDGRLLIRQPRRGYRAATDPVFLAAFVPARPGERVLELGCGAGIAVLCLARRVPGLDLHGLELQPAYAALARRNAAENGLVLTVHEGDLRRMPPALRGAAFDHVLINPPFHPEAAPGAADPGRDRAHREGEATLGNWMDAALRRLAPGGWLSLIHRPERLGAILAALAGRAGAVQLLPLAPREGRPAARVLVRARKSSAAPMILHPPLTVHSGSSHSDSRDSYTHPARAVLRDMAEILQAARADGTTHRNTTNN